MAFRAMCFVLGPGVDAEDLKKRTQRDFPGLLVQVANSRDLRNEALVELIAWQTRAARAAGCLLAKTPQMDMLLRIAGTTQIAKAIRNSGARKGEENLLIIAGELRELERFHIGGSVAAERLGKGRLNEGERVRLEKAAMLNALRG